MKTNIISLTAAFASLFLLSACLENNDEEAGSSDTPAAPTVDVTGTWKGACTVDGRTEGGTIVLQQTGSNVTGAGADNLNYTGTIDGNRLILVANVPNNSGGLAGSIQLSGPVVGDSMELSGSVSANSGQGIDISVPASCTWTRQ